jgi:hypothetical protein
MPPLSERTFARPEIERELKQSVMMRRFWPAVLVTIVTVGASISYAEPPKSRNSEPIISHIPRQPVQSTVIAKIGYSKRLQILEIEFLNGAIYRYVGVPRSIYHHLIAARSKARYYHENIRGKYRSFRVRPWQKEEARN